MDTSEAKKEPVKVTALAPVNQAKGSIDAFANEGNFTAAQRMAKGLASSSLVPQAFQNNIPNVLIAMELATRIGASVFAVMQNLDIIHGRPSWRATFLIATVNACGRFTPLRYRWVGTPGKDDWGCFAVAKDRESGEECVGPTVTMAMAKAEGWATKSGSKWKTLPSLMFCYRSAAFWTRVYAPELSLGMHTGDEMEDVYGGRAVQEAELVEAPSAETVKAALEQAEAQTTPPVEEPKASAHSDNCPYNIGEACDCREPGADG